MWGLCDSELYYDLSGLHCFHLRNEGGVRTHLPGFWRGFGEAARMEHVWCGFSCGRTMLKAQQERHQVGGTAVQCPCLGEIQKLQSCLRSHRALACPGTARFGPGGAVNGVVPADRRSPAFPHLPHPISPKPMLGTRVLIGLTPDLSMAGPMGASFLGGETPPGRLVSLPKAATTAT